MSSKIRRTCNIACIANGEAVVYGDSLTSTKQIAEMVEPRAVVTFTDASSLETIVVYGDLLQKGVVPLLVSSTKEKRAFQNHVEALLQVSYP